MKTNSNAITVNALVAACNVALVGYKARTSEADQAKTIDKNGMQSDIGRGIKCANSMTPTHLDALNALNLGDAFLSGIANATNTKKVMRAIEVAHVLAGASASTLKASARVFFIAIGAVALARCTSRDGLARAVLGRGHGNENTSDGIDLIAAQKLSKIGSTTRVSIDTQYSVCFSVGGIGDILGIAHKGAKNEMFTHTLDNEIGRAIVKRVAGLTDIEIEALAQVNEKPAKAPRKGKNK